MFTTSILVRSVCILVGWPAIRTLLTPQGIIILVILRSIKSQSEILIYPQLHSRPISILQPQQYRLVKTPLIDILPNSKPQFTTKAIIKGETISEAIGADYESFDVYYLYIKNADDAGKVRWRN